MLKLTSYFTISSDVWELNLQNDKGENTMLPILEDPSSRKESYKKNLCLQSKKNTNYY